MGWKETLYEACRDYDARDYQRALKRANTALFEASQIHGEEGEKAEADIRKLLLDLQKKLAEEEKPSGKNAHSTVKATTEPVKLPPRTPAELWGDIVHALCALGCGIYGFTLAHGQFKPFIDSLHPFGRTEDSSLAWLDGLVRCAAVYGVVMGCFWVGRGVGAFLESIIDSIGQDVGKPADSSGQQFNAKTLKSGSTAKTSSSAGMPPYGPKPQTNEVRRTRKKEGFQIGMGIATVFALPALLFGGPDAGFHVIVACGVLFGGAGALIGSYIWTQRETFSLGEGMRRVKKRKIDLNPEWVHIRTYEKCYFDDVWQIVRAYFDNARTPTSRKWDVPTPNLDQGRIDIHSDSKLHVPINHYGTRSSVESDFHLHGVIIFRQVRPQAVRLEFTWMPPGWTKPEGATELIDDGNESVVEQRAKLHWQKLYAELDGHLGTAKLGPRG